MSNEFPENPYETTPGESGNSTAIAQSKVQGPAIGLIVTGVFWVLGALYSLFNGIFAMFFMDTAMMQNAANQQQLEELQAQGVDMGSIMKMSGGVYVGLGVLALVIAIVIIVAGVKMMKLKSRGLAFTASILAMLPCSCGCLVGIPVGIWSLIVLNSPEVKSAFS